MRRYNATLIQDIMAFRLRIDPYLTEVVMRCVEPINPDQLLHWIISEDFEVNRSLEVEHHDRRHPVFRIAYEMIKNWIDLQALSTSILAPRLYGDNSHVRVFLHQYDLFIEFLQVDLSPQATREIHETFHHRHYPYRRDRF